MYVERWSVGGGCVVEGGVNMLFFRSLLSRDVAHREYAHQIMSFKLRRKGE